MNAIVLPARLALLASALTAPVALAAGTPAHRAHAIAGHAASGMARHGCDEMEECFAEGLDLSNEQQEQVRSIMEHARKKRDALREDTFNRVKGVLTPAQARKLEEHRSELMKLRARHLRERADRMDQRAREMKPADGAPSQEGSTPSIR